MQDVLKIFNLLSDRSRLRIIMLLGQKELCVCQIMGVLDMSQPLVSRNLALLAREGFLDARRDGKLMFYRIKKKLTKKNLLILGTLKELLEGDKVLVKDLMSLKECGEFQKKTGRCDMETLKAFIEHKKKRRAGGSNA